MSVAELKKELEKREIEIPKKSLKADLVRLLKAAVTNESIYLYFIILIIFFFFDLCYTKPLQGKRRKRRLNERLKKGN